MTNRVFILIVIFATTFLGQSKNESPYQDLSWTLDGGLLLSAVGLKAIASATESSVKMLSLEDVTNLNKDDLNWLDKSATSRNSEFARNTTGAATIVSFFVPALLLWSSKVRDDWGTFTLMYLEIFALSATVADVAKNLAQRTRPFVYNPDVPLEGYDDLEFDDKVDNKDANKSFFSSDVAIAFALASFTTTVFNDYYPNSKLKPYVNVGTGLYAAFVAFLRYDSGWHFPTDIIAGAVVGGTIGWLVPSLHKNNNVSVGMSYQPNIESNLFTISYRF